MFLPRPLYTVGEVAQLLNAYEQTKAADRHGQRPIWNRRRTRELTGHTRAIAFEVLRAVAPEAALLVRGQD